MPLGSSRIALCAALLCAAPVWAGEAGRPARLCPEDAPEGVRLPPRTGCAGGAPERAATGDGFRDIGGVKVRVGGRVGAEYGIR